MELSVWRKWWHRVGERELRSVSMEAWDPIGVSDVPEAADEYDRYIGQIAKRLREGASAEELAAFLGDLAEGMGLDPTKDANLAAACRMREWYDSSTSRFANRNANP
jgi:hypothetical protein